MDFCIQGFVLSYLVLDSSGVMFDNKRRLSPLRLFIERVVVVD